MNIVLVGFMGTGKTAVAKALSKSLKMEYVSMDDIIRKKEAKSINEIFSQDGEPYFRKVEKEVAEDLSKRNNVIIDAGGGVVLNEENVKNLKKNGKIVCLNATPDVIYERTKKRSHRPLLNVADPRKKITELLNFRAPYYGKADMQIDTSQKGINEVCQEIIKLTKV